LMMDREAPHKLPALSIIGVPVPSPIWICGFIARCFSRAFQGCLQCLTAQDARQAYQRRLGIPPLSLPRSQNGISHRTS
jgi:hypothetical protein